MKSGAMMSLNTGLISSSSCVGETEYMKLGKGKGNFSCRPASYVVISCETRSESGAGNWKTRKALSLISSLNALRWADAIAEWADEIKERGMEQRRQLYSHDDWLKHRSSKRHIRHLLSSFSSRVILSLVPPLCIVGVISVAIATYNTGVSTPWLPSFMPLLHASSTLPYELMAPALALLLVFRTEGSYDRYDEGRKTWTQVISSTKDFARHANSWIRHSNSDAPALKSLLLSYIMAFPVALKDSHISQFNESVSVCERLIRSPIPLSYTRLTSRFLVFWHLILPIILWDESQWMVIPATLFSASILFCIEEVAVLIEEPFPILALDKMCALVHENILEIIDFQGVVEGHLQIKKDKLCEDHVSNLNGSARITL